MSKSVAAQAAACKLNPVAANTNCDAGFVDSTGNVADPVRVPDYTFAITGTYNIDAGFMTIRPTATVSIEGAHAIGTTGDSRPTSDRLAYIGDELMLDLGTTFIPTAYPNVSFTAECKNCLNNNFPVSELPPNDFLNNPGIWDVKVRYKFDLGHEAPAVATPYMPPPVQTPAPAPSVAHSYMVFFDFNKSDLTAQALTIVDQAAKNAGPAKATELVVTGHTDTVGSDAYNMRLSRRRAESVAAELEKQGIKSSEIEIVAKGKHDLLVPTKDGVKEPQNRRVTIVYGGAMS